MEIKLHGEYTDQDILHGLALMRGRVFQVLGIVFGIVVTFALLPTVISILSGEAEATEQLTNILTVLFLLLLFGFMLWRVRRTLRRC